MKKSNENLVPLDFNPIEDQYRQLIDTFDVNFNHKKDSKLSLIYIFLSANKSSSILLGKRIQSTFTIMERFPSTFETFRRMDRSCTNYC